MKRKSENIYSIKTYGVDEIKATSRASFLCYDKR